MSAVKGTAEQGFVVDLPTVPHQFLIEAPLVDGHRIDRHVVELAEWGARLVEKGYLLEEPEDQHPLAWQRIIDPESGSEADGMATLKLWQQTKKHISAFPGRTKKIEGRQYLSFADYLKWRGRHAKGDRKSRIDRGLVVADWNEWVEQHGGEGVASLAEVEVGKLSCHLHGYRYRVCRDAAELVEAVIQRRSLLESVQVGKPDGSNDERFRRRVERWKGLALGFLPEIYALHGAIDSINNRYSDGHQILFPAVAEGFDQLLELVEKTVGIYNDALAGDIERLAKLLNETGDGQDQSPLTIDLAGLVENVEGSARAQVAYFVDMAKAEALDLLGETRQGWELVDRHV